MNLFTGKKSLRQQLRRTIICLCIALFGLWLLFYILTNNVIKTFTMQNMEQVSVNVMDKLNQSFLELQEYYFSLTDNENVNSFLREKDSLQFYQKAGVVEQELEHMTENATLANNIIVFTNEGTYYRFRGDISNTAVQKIYYKIENQQDNKTVQIELEGIRYMGYVESLYDDKEQLGKIVMLIDESEIYRVFEEEGGQSNMRIGLSLNDVIITSKDENWLGMNTNDILQSTKYVVHEKVGFMPYEIFVEYEDTNQELNFVFIIAIAGSALILWLILRQFLAYWRGKFFEPVTEIIQGVEKLSGSKGETIPRTGMEYYDVLVEGINDMLLRIEEKEEALYKTALSLKEEEIKRQKAFIVSLKKQINAHFTVNVLNSIKALGEQGDSEKAGHMCDGLSYLLRYANAEQEYISLMEEFFVLDKYISLMEIRYPRRFSMMIDVEDSFAEFWLPRMLVQPIVENSILHGYVDHPLVIKVSAGVDEDEQELWISIEDDGCGMEESKLKHLQHELLQESDDNVAGLSHVALLNIQQRIRSYYGNSYGVDISSVQGEGTKVVIQLPLIEKR